MASVGLVAVLCVGTARAAPGPRVAIVFCADSYEEGWQATQASTQALVGLAGLVGVAYDTLTLDELGEPGASAHDSLWFGSCPFVAEERIDALAARLRAHVHAGGSLLLDGPLGVYYRDDSGGIRYRGMSGALGFLGVDSDGWRPIAGYEIHAVPGSHPVAVRAGHRDESQLTQGVPYGMHIMRHHDDVPGGAVLLELVSPDSGQAHPYLVAAEPAAGARVLAVGAYGDHAGVATPFRNHEPAGFHDNQLIPYLIVALLWLIGPDGEPFAGLQLSHAPMTVIGRLDGDWSNSPAATRRAVDALIELGERTGVATVYGIVSSFADSVGWEGFHAGLAELEALGGSVGSHSRSHPFRMSDTLDAQGFASEVAGSLEDIRAALTSASFAPEAVAFINPGDIIQGRDYGHFFADIELYMTHGLETSVPYASGVMGFGLPPGVSARPIINNTPVPDFHWLYAPDWVYTVEEAAGLQARLLDHYQGTIGRGVLYNQMWHDYALSDLLAPVHDPDAPTVLPLFDVSRRHFETAAIYTPGVRELVAKMHVAQRAAVSSSLRGDALELVVDYRGVPAQYRGHAAGMGLRVHHAPGPIQAVLVDGVAHHAFSEHTVILPADHGDAHEITVRFGAPAGMRLRYLSRSFARIIEEDERLIVQLDEPGLATRLCVAGPVAVIVHVDALAADAEGALCGRIDFGADTRWIEAVARAGHGLQMVRADRRIHGAYQSDTVLALDLAAGPAIQLDLAAVAMPLVVRVDGHAVEVAATEQGFAVPVPATNHAVAVEVHMPAHDPGADGSGCACAAASRPDSAAGPALILAFLVLMRRLWRPAA